MFGFVLSGDGHFPRTSLPPLFAHPDISLKLTAHQKIFHTKPEQEFLAKLNATQFFCDRRGARFRSWDWFRRRPSVSRSQLGLCSASCTPSVPHVAMDRNLWRTLCVQSRTPCASSNSDSESDILFFELLHFSCT